MPAQCSGRRVSCALRGELRVVSYFASWKMMPRAVRCPRVTVETP